MKKKCDRSQLNFEEFQPLICWKAGLSYGFVIYFEMKDQIFEPALSSNIGSASLWINGDHWEIYHNKIFQSDSEAIGNTDIPLLNSFFYKKSFYQSKMNKKV